jgi:hypothetical protein
MVASESYRDTLLMVLGKARHATQQTGASHTVFLSTYGLYMYTAFPINELRDQDQVKNIICRFDWHGGDFVEMTPPFLEINTG